MGFSESTKRFFNDRLQWVFCKKDSEQYKTKLVAKEYSEKKGIDYNEIFSPIVKHTFIRLLLKIVTQGDRVGEADMKTTFLYSELEERIYMKKFEGYFQEGQENKVCLLKKSLYGLKQSLRQWYKQFDSFMIKVNYSRCGMIIVFISSSTVIVSHCMWMIC